MEPGAGVIEGGGGATVEWRPWVLLGVLSLVAFMVNASTYGSLGVVLPSMAAEFKWTWGSAGLGFTILGVACGSSSLLPTLLIRRFGVRWTLATGALIMAAGFYSLSAVRGLPAYFLGTALCGVGYQTLSLIPGTHILAAAFKKRGFPFGLYFAIGSLGNVAGPVMVVAVMHVFHDHWRAFWQVQMAAAAALGLICVIMVGGPAWLARIAERTDSEVALEAAAPVRSGAWRTAADWTLREAVRTPQFLILLAAYFAQLLVGVTVAGLSTPHLMQRGVAWSTAAYMLSLEGIMQVGGRGLVSLAGDRIEPRYLLIFALAALGLGAAALSVADSYPMMLVFAVGSGLGWGLAGLAVTTLLLNYFGRKHNLEIFSFTCLVGAVSALGPVLGGALRDATGAFSLTFQLCAGVAFLVLLAAILMRPPKVKAPSHAL